MRWFLNTFLVAGFVLFCYAAPTLAQFPSVPKVRPAAVTQQTEPVATAPAPVVIPAPQVTVEAPPSNDFFNYIWTALGGIATLLFGKGVLFPSGSKLKLTPEMRAMIDQVAIKAVESGATGMAIKAGAGLVPGGGVLADLGEPMLRKLALEGLHARLAQNQGTTVPLPPTAVNGEAPPHLDFGALAELVADKVKARMGS